MPVIACLWFGLDEPILGFICFLEVDFQIDECSAKITDGEEDLNLF